jgi:hypothetical protein
MTQSKPRVMMDVRLRSRPWKGAVIDWAERYCLSDGVGAASVHTFGESLVTYLIDELGEAERPETLAV